MRYEDIFSLNQITEQKESVPEVRVALNLAYMNSEGKVMEMDLKDSEKHEHVFESITFSNTFKPTNTSKFFDTL